MPTHAVYRSVPLTETSRGYDTWEAHGGRGSTPNGLLALRYRPFNWWVADARVAELPDTGSSGHSSRDPQKIKRRGWEQSHKPASAWTAAVFLSYASQDAAAAQRICEALRASGIDRVLSDEHA